MKGIIFDMDGVLIDSGSFIFPSYQHTLQQLGVEFTLEEKHILHGRKMDDIVNHLSAVVGKKLDVDEFLQISNDYQFVLFDQTKTTYGKHVDAVEAVKNEGYVVGVATSSTDSRAYRFLKDAGYRFEHVVTGKDVVNSKPDPEIFLKAATMMGCDPEYCLVVEDAPDGIRAAVAAGIKAVGIRTSEQDPELLRQLGAVDVLERFTEFSVAVYERAFR